MCVLATIDFVVDIREVPSKMPMYLLAEDEGNEEEILRLLESESPGASPPPNSSDDSNHHCVEQPSFTDLREESVLPATLSSEYF